MASSTLSLLQGDDAPGVVGFDVRRIDPHGGGEALGGLRPFPLLGEHGAGVVVRVGLRRVQLQGRVELLQRLVELALPGEHDAPVVVRLGKVGPDLPTAAL